MSDWSRLYDACKDATGTEITDIYDAHLVVEELDDKCRKLTKENDLLRSVSKRSELLIGLLTMLEKEGGNEFIDKAEIVAKYEANL